MNGTETQETDRTELGTTIRPRMVMAERKYRKMCSISCLNDSKSSGVSPQVMFAGTRTDAAAVCRTDMDAGSQDRGGSGP